MSPHVERQQVPTPVVAKESKGRFALHPPAISIISTPESSTDGSLKRMSTILPKRKEDDDESTSVKFAPGGSILSSTSKLKVQKKSVMFSNT